MASSYEQFKTGLAWCISWNICQTSTGSFRRILGWNPQTCESVLFSGALVQTKELVLPYLSIFFPCTFILCCAVPDLAGALLRVMPAPLGLHEERVSASRGVRCRGFRFPHSLCLLPATCPTSAVLRELQTARERSDILPTTGGLGPKRIESLCPDRDPKQQGDKCSGHGAPPDRVSEGSLG